MLDRLKNNFSSIKRYFAYGSGVVFGVISTILTFFSWDDIKITNTIHKLIILVVLTLLIAFVSIILVLFRKKNKLFGDINSGVELCYNDIIKLGFPKNHKENRIVVIPVNRCFDMTFENCLIAKNSIHGQWLTRYLRSEKDRVELSKIIKRYLDENCIVEKILSRDEKKAGNLERYSPGTVVELEGKKGVTFYLLALSSFDSDLRAHCTETEFYVTIQGLLNHYDSHGQSQDLYCPIMGDHIVRPKRDTLDILSHMRGILQFNKNKIHGIIHLVVYEKMKSHISIL